MKRTEEIVDLLEMLDSTPAVDALAALLWQMPTSKTALALVDWVSSHDDEDDPEAVWQILADELLLGRAFGPSPEEVMASWVAAEDINTYAEILSKAPSYAERALALIERYTGDELWNDCINVAGYDSAATDAADPTYRNTIAIYTDGSRLQYNESEHRWHAFTNNK